MLSYKDRILHVEGRSLLSLADDLGTPLFLMSESRLRGNYEALQRGLSQDSVTARIRYCAKANNEAGVLRILAACGAGVLVSHLAEAELALRCGFPPEGIAFQRPVLSVEEVRLVLALGVHLFHAHHTRDLEILEKVTVESGTNLNVSLRLRNEASTFPFSPLGFLSHRLGFTYSEVLRAASFVAASRGLHLQGINVHQGTQQNDPRRYRKMLRKTLDLAARIHAHCGLTLEEINLGGGIPSPSVRRLGAQAVQRRLVGDGPGTAGPEALRGFAQRLSVLFSQEVAATKIPGLPVLAVEPGRSIVSDAAILVTRVHAVRGPWAFLDASRNHLAENPFLFTRRILPVALRGDGRVRHYHLSGSTLNTTDVLDVWRALPTLSEGDVLALCDAGAYTISRASRYAGLTPALYMLRPDGTLDMARRPEGLADLARPMLFEFGTRELPDH